MSSSALPLESGILPGAAGLTLYSAAKKFFRVEVDQQAAIRLNGDTGNTNRMSPRVVGDPESMAHMEKFGPVWSLVVVNRSSTSQCNVNVMTVE